MNVQRPVIGIPPALTEETAPFWEAAQDGRLLCEVCLECGAQSFPPRRICRTCGSRNAGWIQIDRPGHVYSYTVNHHRWLPDMEVPFVIVLVEFADHPGVRIPGRLRGCAIEAVTIGMSVAVGFEPGPGGFAVPSFIAVPADKVGGGT